MTSEVVPEMTLTCTRDLTDRIKTAAQDLEEMLYKAHEGKAWQVLGYESWTTYCNVEFQFSKQRSYQLLHFVEIKNSLAAESQPGLTPKTEKQTRSLVKLEPEQRTAVWKQAVELADGKQPTAKQVELSVRNFTTSARQVEVSVSEFTRTLPSVAYVTRDAQPSWTASQRKRKAQVEKGESVLANADKDNALIAWAESENKLVRIDEQSVWKNPFEVDEDGTKDETVEWFKEYFNHKRSLHKRLHQLKGKVLTCWCYPDKCHGDHYLELIRNWRDER